MSEFNKTELLEKTTEYMNYKLNSVVTLKEDPDGWLFWTGDLQKVDSSADLAERNS